MAINVKIRIAIYIRRGPGKSFDPPIGRITPSGAIVVMDGKEEGESWKGINTWYFKINNRGTKQYYWGGGIEVSGGEEEAANGDNDLDANDQNDAGNEEEAESLPGPNAGVLDEGIDLQTDAASSPVTYNWEITDYGIDKLWEQSKGAGVKVAVIDTGLNYNHTNIRNKKNIEYLNLSTGSTNREDCLDTNGHGTHCAGVICAQGPDVYGIAPDADLLVIKATDDGDMQCKDLANAIIKAVDLRANIISVSYSFLNREADIELLKTAAQHASDNNVLIVASTGDSGPVVTKPTFPASYPFSAGVGASDQNKSLWTGTTINPDIDILAPGVNVVLIGPGDAGKTTDSGTSYSTPYVAGVVALLMAASGKPPIDIADELKQSADSRDGIRDQLQQLYTEPDLIVPIGVIKP